MEAVEKLRKMVNWANNSNETVNYSVLSIDHFEKLYDLAIASNWDVTLEEIPEDAWDAACEGRHAEAVSLLDAWMKHHETHTRTMQLTACKHCVADREERAG